MTKYITRLEQGAQIRFGLSAVIVLLASFFIIWPNYQKFVATRKNIILTDQKIANEEIELETERDIYRALKTQYNTEAILSDKTISTILPKNAEETNIVRELEKKANELAGDDKSFVLEKVNFGKNTAQKDSDYFVLPIKISISGSEEKIMTFLRYLEKTGSISAEVGKATRLLDIKDISIDLKNRGAQTEMENNITADLSIDSYSLPTSEEIAAAKTK
ncbi:hypothetical protein K9N08_01180 [Candidatus Gracilibacteria bacterium]|nr:hypothetical protein [Candidatus Gracilibacteria bacterium]MCF7856155.1 hypothetical protein [Candidatus Gracilibacteria bacterium]MCF7896621.1 hypothetical protein [Candidatus Gracilibacteria bacterium]